MHFLYNLETNFWNYFYPFLKQKFIMEFLLCSKIIFLEYIERNFIKEFCFRKHILQQFYIFGMIENYAKVLRMLNFV